MKLPRPTTLFASFLLCTLIASCRQTQKKDLLLGKWNFEKFEFTGELVNIPPEEAKKANDINKGLIITFSSDNKFSTEQKGGTAINNSKEGTYLLLPDDRLIMMGDTTKIIQLDKSYLRLYRADLSPIAVFKRQ
jgi:hypothetical protein